MITMIIQLASTQLMTKLALSNQEYLRHGWYNNYEEKGRLESQLGFLQIENSREEW